MQQSDYTDMLAADGSPKPMEWIEWQRKMGDIAKGKAPGYSGNTPDGSLSNHRPLCLIEVLRKEATSISRDRMRRDWNRMHLLGDANPGFQAGCTTANSILPLRLAAEHCVATKQHFD